MAWLLFCACFFFTSFYNFIHIIGRTRKEIQNRCHIHLCLRLRHNSHAYTIINSTVSNRVQSKKKTFSLISSLLYVCVCLCVCACLFVCLFCGNLWVPFGLRSQDRSAQAQATNKNWNQDNNKRQTTVMCEMYLNLTRFILLLKNFSTHTQQQVNLVYFDGILFISNNKLRIFITHSQFNFN